MNFVENCQKLNFAIWKMVFSNFVGEPQLDFSTGKQQTNSNLQTGLRSNRGSVGRCSGDRLTTMIVEFYCQTPSARPKLGVDFIFTL